MNLSSKAAFIFYGLYGPILTLNQFCEFSLIHRDCHDMEFCTKLSIWRIHDWWTISSVGCSCSGALITSMQDLFPNSRPDLPHSLITHIYLAITLIYIQLGMYLSKHEAEDQSFKKQWSVAKYLWFGVLGLFLVLDLGVHFCRFNARKRFFI